MARRGGFPGGMGGFGGMNLNNLMKEAKKMQADLEKTQTEIAAKEFESTAGGGAITVKVSGKKVIKEIKTGILDGNHAQVREFFDDARKYRDSFSNITPGSFVKRYEISVDVLDKPGSIAVISVLLSSNGINIKNMSIVNNRERENGVLYVSFDSEEQRQKSIDILKSMNYEVQIKN